MSHPSHVPVEVHETDAKTVAFGAFVGTALEWYDFFLFGTAASLVFNRLYFATDSALRAANPTANDAKAARVESDHLRSSW